FFLTHFYHSIVSLSLSLSHSPSYSLSLSLSLSLTRLPRLPPQLSSGLSLSLKLDAVVLSSSRCRPAPRASTPLAAALLLLVDSCVLVATSDYSSWPPPVDPV
ncbi:hypothetical protein PanWU01x14_026390, partial [Parasponia andersonii]